jgi:hypothetical protein
MPVKARFIEHMLLLRTDALGSMSSQPLHRDAGLRPWNRGNMTRATLSERFKSVARGHM